MRRACTLFLALLAFWLAGLAGASTAAGPSVSVKPRLVRLGGTIKIIGTHFRTGLRIGLYIGRPHSDNTTKIGALNAGPRGGFTVRHRLSRLTTTGRYVLLACQRQCRVKATAPFTVTKKPPPL